MWLIDGPLFSSKVSSKCPAVMLASVSGRIRLRDFVFKIFSCDLRYTLGKVKVKQSRYRPGVAQRVPGS